ncbi:MAG: 3-keto-5-aminohexanoate cleavage protein [Alphaproteobacteria bacterium]|nr:3-keto-5-aminohexanoate cleavage protein [Alphaproteobacteria bacterium]
MQKLIIEARINEYQGRAENPKVPFLPAEIAADAAACRAAGAAVVHFHCRQADGQPEHSHAAYAETIRLIRAGSDLLTHPTLGYVAHEAGPQERLATVMRLAADPATRPDLAPMDMGTVNIDSYDPLARRFVSKGRIYRNDTATLEYFATQLVANGIKPYQSLWNISFMRQAYAFMDMSLVPEPAYHLFLLSGDSLLAGHPGSAAGLAAFTGLLPDRPRAQWTVCNFNGDLLPLAESIIRQGGHISIGLGDHPYAEYGRPSNAELVARVRALAERLGRPAATPAEARGMLGMR